MAWLAARHTPGSKSIFPAQAGRSDPRTSGQARETEKMVGYEGVARVFALADRREREAFGQVHRHILERMDGKVGATLRHRDFELLDEQTLAADVGERPVENPIPLRGHAEKLDGTPRMTRGEARANVLGLPHRQRGFARGNSERLTRWTHFSA